MLVPDLSDRVWRLLHVPYVLTLRTHLVLWAYSEHRIEEEKRDHKEGDEHKALVKQYSQKALKLADLARTSEGD
jgi:hypothetical protein